MRDLMTCVERIDRRHDAAECRDSVKCDAVFGTVWTQNAEHFAFFETTLREVIGGDRNRVSELLVSGALE